MKKIIKLAALVCLFFSGAVFSLIIYGNEALPDEVMTMTEKVKFSAIYSAELDYDNLTPAFNGEEELQTSKSDIRLFGAIPVKNISISKAPRKYLAAGGDIIGIKLKTDGVLIIGTESFESYDGNVNPAETAGIKVGDTLISADGKKISDNDDLGKIISSSEGKAMTLRLKRNNTEFETTLIPHKSTLTDMYKGGLWVRDSTGGIGTLTFADLTTGLVGALGHGIYDVDTQGLMPTESGNLMSATLSGVTKGCNGTAGELRGSIGTDVYGKIFLNHDNGIFGSVNYFDMDCELYPVATVNEIHQGKAQIISTITGSRKEFFDIEIEKVYSGNENKNMIIRITDEDLLAVTGGIVQGMSGSPIIQDGMLIGAVTHVFLNDPTRGYGIFIENMLNTANQYSAEINGQDAA